MKRISKYVTVMTFFWGLISALILSSCASSREMYLSDDPEPKEEPIRLRFVSSWGGVDSKADSLQKILDRFMEDYPEIAVVNESLFGDDFLPKLKVDFASGNDPDVFGLWPGSDIKTLIRAGKVAELTDILDNDPEWKKSFGEDLWRYTTFDGKIYGLPVEIIFECLFINRDLFQQHHIELPTTYERLKQAVIGFRRKGIVPVAYNSLAEGTYLYQNIVAALGGKEAVEHPYIDGKVNEAFIQGMEYMQELYSLGAFAENSLTMSSYERNRMFIEKKAAMLVQGSWFIGNFNDNDRDVDILPFPAMGSEGSAVSRLIHGLGCGTFYMSRQVAGDADKSDAALKLLRCLTSRESSYLLAERTGMLSNIDMTGYDLHYSRLTQKGIRLMAEAEEFVGPPDSYLNRSVWESVIVEDFPYVLEDKQTPREIWEKAVAKGIFEE